MKTMNKHNLMTSALFGALAVSSFAAEPPKMKMTTDIPEAITTPDKVETRIGTLGFFDGFPDDATTQKVYDNLDFMRGVEAFLNAMPGASAEAIRVGWASQGAVNNQTLLIMESLMDSKSLFLTPNTESIYHMAWLDVSDGPLVIETPPNVLGIIDDHWFRYVGDFGTAGPDKGKGGKYLVLPPGYTGKVPQGYFLLKPPTNRNFLFLRGSIKNGLKPAVENITSKLKVYPLKDAAKPAPTEFVDMSGKAFNTVFPSDFSFFENLNQIVQEEPIAAISPEVRGAIAAIGIVKGQPFAPDARMKKLLTEAATLGNATSRAITYHPRFAGVKIYPDDPKSVWSTAFANKNTSFESNGAMGLDARVLYYFNAGGVTPAMAATRAGEGSDYALAVLDANQQAFDGSKTYKLHLPPNVPVNDFWAVTLYDTQTRSQLQTSQKFPTVGSQSEDIKKNADGSYDLYFSPQPPKGQEGNWLQTVPGKSWFTILRMYGPLQPWIDKTWRPSEIEWVR